jgi:Family of unknown function (DUF5681)
MADNDDDGMPPKRHQAPTYEVGYRRPPQQHQFKKGQPSRHPKGRPPGSRNRAPRLIDVIMEPVNIKLHGRDRKVPYPAAFLEVMKARALKGDQKAAQILFALFKELGLLKPEPIDRKFSFTLKIGELPKRRKTDADNPTE